MTTPAAVAGEIVSGEGSIINEARAAAQYGRADEIAAFLDDGKLMEFAAPSSLLADADSGFSALCDAAGSRQSLIEAARRADERRANGGAPVV